MWPHPNPRKENSCEDFSICPWKISFSSSAHMHCPIIRWGRRVGGWRIKSPCSSSAMMSLESNRVETGVGTQLRCRVGGGTIQSMSQSTSHDNKCCFRCGLWYIFLIIITSAIVALLKSINTATTSISVCELGVFGGGGGEVVAAVETQVDLVVGGRITKLFAVPRQINWDAII